MKTVFIPITSSRGGWSHARQVRLGRFADSFEPDGVTIRCRCGAAYTRTAVEGELEVDPIWKWVDAHGIHMPALPNEPPEHGNVMEYDDADDDDDPDRDLDLAAPNRALSLRPAIRWPDGRIEIPKQPLLCDAPPPPSSGELPLELEEAASRLVRESFRAANVIEELGRTAVTDLDWEAAAANLREATEKLLFAIHIGEEET